MARAASVSTYAANSDILNIRTSGVNIRKMNRVAQGLSQVMNMRSQSNLNIQRMIKRNKPAEDDDTNDTIVTSLYPRPWPAPMQYDKHITTGDVVFTVNGVSADKNWMSMDGRPTNISIHTIINLSQLNKELIMGKFRAMAMAMSSRVAGKIPMIDPKYPAIDPDYLAAAYKFCNHHETSDALAARRNEARNCDKIMKEYVETWEEEIQAMKRQLDEDPSSDVSGTSVAIAAGQEALQKIWDIYDSHKGYNEDIDSYIGYLSGDLVNLVPSLIKQKYTLFGTVEDALQGAKIHRTSYARVGGITIATRGYVKFKNIFGKERKETGALSRLRRQGGNDGFTLSNMNELFLVLATPKGLSYKVTGYRGGKRYTVNPTVVIPAIATDKYSMYTKMNMDNASDGRLACYTHTSSYERRTTDDGEDFLRKDEDFVTPVTAEEDRSWHLGRILRVYPSSSTFSDDNYTLVQGIKDYSMSSDMNDVYDLRKVVGDIEVNLTTK